MLQKVKTSKFNPPFEWFLFWQAYQRHKMKMLQHAHRSQHDHQTSYSVRWTDTIVWSQHQERPRPPALMKMTATSRPCQIVQSRMAFLPMLSNATNTMPAMMVIWPKNCVPMAWCSTITARARRNAICHITSTAPSDPNCVSIFLSCCIDMICFVDKHSYLDEQHTSERKKYAINPNSPLLPNWQTYPHFETMNYW